MAKLSVEERVRRGIALLDKKGPENWRTNIDLSDLDLKDPWDCVLGKVYGTFSAGVLALGIGSLASRYGFNVYESTNWHYHDAEYDALEVEWVRQLRG